MTNKDGLKLCHALSHVKDMNRIIQTFPSVTPYVMRLAKEFYIDKICAPAFQPILAAALDLYLPTDDQTNWVRECARAYSMRRFLGVAWHLLHTKDPFVCVRLNDECDACTEDHRRTLGWFPVPIDERTQTSPEKALMRYWKGHIWGPCKVSSFLNCEGCHIAVLFSDVLANTLPSRARDVNVKFVWGGKHDSNASSSSSSLIHVEVHYLASPQPSHVPIESGDIDFKQSVILSIVDSLWDLKFSSRSDQQLVKHYNA